MNRLYCIEAMPTPTGFAADRRQSLRVCEIESLVSALAVKLGVMAGPADTQSTFVDIVANDLQVHSNRSLVIAGPCQSRTVHELVHAINAKLGNFGATIFAVPPVGNRSETGLPELCKVIDRREVDTLLVLSSNPIYDAPADLEFAKRFGTIRQRIRLGMYEDETGTLCHWHVPEAHYLESWSDAVATDGTASIIQPLIAPLYEGKTPHEVIAAFVNLATGKPANATGESSGWQVWRGREIVRDYWRKWHGEKQIVEPFELFWRKAVHDGVVAGSASTQQSPTVRDGFLRDLGARALASEKGLELVIRPDPTTLDGRFANNAWLQELPKPLTKLVWDNAAIVSPATADNLGIVPTLGPHGGNRGELITELVELTWKGRTVTAPLYVLPGHADDAVTLHFGYGRSRAGRVGTYLGVSAYAMQTSDAPWGGAGLEIKRTGQPYTLACTQGLHSMQGRNLVRLVTVAEFAKIRPAPRNSITRIQPATILRSRDSRTSFTPTRRRVGRINGAWLLISARATVAWPAWWLVRPKTTFRSSANSRSLVAGRCTGSASIAISPAILRIRWPCISRSCASIVKTRRAKSFARSRPPRIATTASTK